MKNTKGVIYSAPATPLFTNLIPSKDETPAATIPLGPIQLINNFSRTFKVELTLLKNTPAELNTKTINKNSANACQLNTSIKSSILILAANKMKRIETNKTLSDS